MKKYIFVLACLFLLTIIGKAQTFDRSANLNIQVTENTVVYPFDGNSVSGIGVSGNVSFTSEMGFVRFVVCDNYGDEYLVYESYRLFEQDSVFNFSQKCEESCFYEGYVPTEFKIYVNDAVVTLNSVNMSSAIYGHAAEELRESAAENADNLKLAAVQNYISENGLIWIADHTKLSDLSYSEKVNLWGDGFMTYGYEYYDKGIFSLFSPNKDGVGELTHISPYVASFDWRDRHGANNPNSGYYNSSGTGWITPVTCQLGCWKDGVFSCGTVSQCEAEGGEWRTAPSCWAFGATAQVEALANLYYNDTVNLDLSEQYVICKEAEAHNWTWIHGHVAKYALNHYVNEGVPYANLWPYTATLENCDLYDDPAEGVTIGGYSWFDYGNVITLEQLLESLINNGPIAAGGGIPYISDLTHCMLLVGWGTIDKSTVSNITGYPGYANCGDEWLGTTYWIYKDSYGPYEHNDGYAYIVHNRDSIPKRASIINTPINVPGKTENDINCYDKDGDGYYFWGVGPKPAHCPPCPDEPDGDDSNPALGPMNEYGQCTIIDTYNSNFEEGWDGWVQGDYYYTTNETEDWYRNSGLTGHHFTNGEINGPSSAQSGDFYLYAKGTSNVYYATPHTVVSPPIDLSKHNVCGCHVDFYYHMNPYLWGNNDTDCKLRYITKQNGMWELSSPKTIVVGDRGDEWHHCTLALPKETEQIMILSQNGNNYCDIAIDNITIGPLYYDENPVTIDGDVVWSEETQGTDSIYVNKDIVVEDGAKLTITNAGIPGISAKFYVNVHPDSKIIVKPGGKLILDGCILDCACNDDMWQGIQVWGDNTKDQVSRNGYYYQGFLEMKNNSAIKNAICAVDLWNPGHYYSTGGIIHARNSCFENNAQAIHALHYNQTAPNGNVSNYNANFTECNFEINGTFRGIATFYKHIDLANVTGVRFHGCDFKMHVNPSIPRIENVSPYSKAIAAYNAGFTVDGIYSYSHDGTAHVDKRSTFSGFHQGAYSVRDGAGGAKTFTVKDCDFSNNDFGVFAIEPSFATVIHSTFRVGRDNSETCNAGVFLNSTQGFLVEENTFRKGSNAVEGNNYGIIIKDSKGLNELYRNTINGLYCGNIAEGKNRTSVLDDAPGLTYGCNDNDNNDIDFYVDIIFDQETEGIQRSQGSVAVPAGNTFSDNASYHFYNEGIYVDYYYNPSMDGATPDENKLYRVGAHSTSSLNECPSHYSGDSIIITPVIPPARRQAAEQQFNESREIYNSLKAVYENRVDGGSTTSTVSDVKAARPEDMWMLRSKLLRTSPYLSEDVLYAAADRDDVLPSSVLFEILISNPDELKKDALVHYMANKKTPLPEYMIDILHEVASGTSAKTVLLSNMARYSHEAEIAAGDIIRSIMNDSVIERNDLVTWLGNLQDLGADRDIISIYMAEGNFDDALTLADMLPDLYNLEGEDLEDHNDYMQLLNLYRTLAQDGRTTMQLSDVEKNLVEGIADNGKGTSQAMAQSLLKAVYGYFDESCPETAVAPGGRGGGKITYTEEDISRAMGLSVKANPNPANTWVAVDYTLPEGFNDAVITLTNSLGLTVYTQTIHGLQGQDVIDMQELPVGVYILTIRCEDHSLTEKVVVAR